MRLPDAARAAGYRLDHRAATGSTNEDGLALAGSGDPGFLWIVADMQTSGRGRHGRVWSSPPGNLHASVLLIDPCPVSEAAQLGFVAGLALHDAVHATTGRTAPDVALKWPNDLLIRGAKAAGLLLEGRSLRGGGFALVVGIGVNVREQPSDTPYPALALTALDPEIDREAVFSALASSWVTRLAEWERSGFPPILAAWRQRAAGIGEIVTLRLPAGETKGRFVGLDSSGRLILDTGEAEITVDAGDLFLPSLIDTGPSAPET